MLAIRRLPGTYEHISILGSDRTSDPSKHVAWLRRLRLDHRPSAQVLVEIFITRDSNVLS